MTFEEFKELLEFREEKDDRRQIHYFYARLQTQAKHGIASEVFDMDKEAIRAYMHNELACMIWDLCMQIFGPTYTVDDLRKAHEMGRCGCSFDYALKAVGDGKGKVAGTDYSAKESFVIRVLCWVIQKAFTDTDIDADNVVRDCLAPLLQSCGFELVRR